MNDTTIYAVAGATIVLLLMAIRWRYKRNYNSKVEELERPDTPYAQGSAQIVHRLCPHHNVVQSFAVEQKDSIDEHLNLLTQKLAEKEGRLRLSKSKIRETQFEIENLQAIDQDVRLRYREIMDNLKKDLLSNEKECKRLQDQIEWVSRRRAELREEVRRGQRMYGEAAAELASNLAEMQRGRVVTDKPAQYSDMALRHRKEPQLPRATPQDSIVIKSPASSSPEPVRSRLIPDRY